MTAGIALLRPIQRSPIDNLLVAGPWTDTGWPATMEGAVRSGVHAARAALPSPPQSTRASAIPRNDLQNSFQVDDIILLPDQIGLPALAAHFFINALLGKLLSAPFFAVSTPATGSPAGSSRPI